MKKFLELWLSKYRWARKLHGGKWVMRKWQTATIDRPGEWITWNDPNNIRFTGWPLDENEYACEEYD